MLKSTLQVTLFSLFGIVINFIIQLLLAYFFGASQERDAYFAALTIPAYVTLLFTGSIGMLLVPHIMQNLVNKDYYITASLINFSTIILLILAILAGIFAIPLLKIIVPAGKPELLDSAAYLFRILMFSMIFTVLNNLLISEFHSRHSFFTPSLSNIITNISSLIAVALLSPLIGISSIAYGTLAGGLISFVYLLIRLKKKTGFNWNKKVWTPELKILLISAFPLFGAGLIFRSTTVFERYFAARLPEGSLSYLGSGNQVILILSTIVSTGIATTSFPLLSKYWSEKNLMDLEKIFINVISIILMIVFPLIVIFIACGKDVISILFQHGAFTSSDTTALYYTLLGLMGYFLFSSMGNIVARVLYISNKTKAASIIAISELAIYIAGAAILTNVYGYVGLALSMSVSSAFNVIASIIFIRAKIISIHLRDLIKRAGLILIVSLVVLLPVFLLNRSVMENSDSFLKAVTTILLSCLLFWIIFAVVLKDKYYMSLVHLIRNKTRTND